MPEAPRIVRVRVAPDIAGEYRFTAFSSNGRAIVVSSEGYRNHVDALAAAVAVFPEAEIEDVTNG